MMDYRFRPAGTHWHALRAVFPRLNLVLTVGYAAESAMSIAVALPDRIPGSAHVGACSLETFWLSRVLLAAGLLGALLPAQHLIDDRAARCDERAAPQRAAATRLAGVLAVTVAGWICGGEFGTADWLILAGLLGLAVSNNDRSCYRWPGGGGSQAACLPTTNEAPVDGVARGRIELPTYRFSGGRSYQLSYLAVHPRRPPASEQKST